ncbi:MAG: cytochrome C552 [bacterium]|nr:cytochrome C552 [bacterium]
MRYLILIVILGIAFLGMVSLYAVDTVQADGQCMVCHKKQSPGLYNQWYGSQHAAHNVTCIDCHQAERGDDDAFDHYEARIATLVTPKDCGKCHEKETNEVGNSYHAHAGEILDSNDAYLAHVAGGLPVAIVGCENCHGSKVKIDPASPNKLSTETWPNSGIGRINPDGSKGSCNACHTRHSFSVSQARQPEACSKCHLGPDHPQKEIYEESKHGNTYYTNKELMNLTSDRWVVGVDYYAAPTCATCHMSASDKQGITHDVGDRIAWTLRPIVSSKKENWETKRQNLKDVCISCHSTTFAEGHFFQFDATVELYNEKFAKPAKDIIDLVRSNGLLENPASFSNKIEWTFWELWHHEGRRARHGASMMGPDYSWWHGFYDIAQHFYFKFLPEARAYNNQAVNQYIDNLLEQPMHKWLSRPTAELKEEINSGKMQEIYKQLFKKK